ncbi:MAG: hypothetical protein NZ821_05985 [Gloeomargarita sp. SKYB31]|nr:hypothetical protein [Gloeomargarita sp. SKYB31]
MAKHKLTPQQRQTLDKQLASQSKRNPKWCVNIITDSFKRPQYFPQVARFPGDPEAHVESRSQLRKILEQRGWGAEGIVSTPYRPDPPPERYTIDPELAAFYADQEIEQRYGGKATPKLRQELIEKYQDKLSGNPPKDLTIEQVIRLDRLAE